MFLAGWDSNEGCRWILSILWTPRGLALTDIFCTLVSVECHDIQWIPSGKARNVSLKLWNLVHFHAPFFTNHVHVYYFCKAIIVGGLYVYIYIYIFPLYHLRQNWFTWYNMSTARKISEIQNWFQQQGWPDCLVSLCLFPHIFLFYVPFYMFFMKKRNNVNNFICLL